MENGHMIPSLESNDIRSLKITECWHLTVPLTEEKKPNGHLNDKKWPVIDL